MFLAGKAEKDHNEMENDCKEAKEPQSACEDTPKGYKVTQNSHEEIYHKETQSDYKEKQNYSTTIRIRPRLL